MKNLLTFAYAVMALALVALIATPARGAGLEYVPEPGEKPAVSAERITVGVGADYAFHQSAAEKPAPFYDNEWALNATASYTWVDQFATLAQTTYYTDNRALLVEPAFRLRLTQPGGPFSVHLGLGYAVWGAKDARSAEAFVNEFRVKAAITKPLWRLGPKAVVAAGASGTYGFVSEAVGLQLGLRLAATAAKEGF